MKQKIGRKLLSFSLSLAMVFGLMPGMNLTAYADQQVSYVYYNTNGKKATPDGSCNSYTVVSDQTAWGIDNETVWLVVNSDETISSRITVTGTVNLILCDGNTLTASNGITVEEGNTLNIYGQENGTGQLNATSSNNDAAIGGIGGTDGTDGSNGNAGKNAGIITIHGGTVTVSSNATGIGIGGGSGGKGGSGADGSGGTNGTGGTGGAGSTGGTGGAGGDGGTVSIYGGKVNVTSSIGGGTGGTGGGAGTGGIGGYGAAGNIGGTGGAGGSGGTGGNGGTGSTVSIYGGEVNVTSGITGGAGGTGGTGGTGGYGGNGGFKTDGPFGDGGTGGNGGSGGTGGYGGDGGTVSIYGGKVNVTSSIGGGTGGIGGTGGKGGKGGEPPSGRRGGNGGSGDDGGTGGNGGTGSTVRIYGGEVNVTSGITGGAGGNGGSGGSGGNGSGGGFNGVGYGTGGTGGNGCSGGTGGTGGDGGTVSIYGGKVNVTSLIGSGGNKGTGGSGGSGGNGGTGGTYGENGTGGAEGDDGQDGGLGILTVTSNMTVKGDNDNNPPETVRSSESYVNARWKYMTIIEYHIFSYSASGATLTATCSVDTCSLENKTATLTIAAPDTLTYNGSAKAAVITDADEIQGDAKVQYQTKSGETYGDATETAPTDAGDYKASITLGEATAFVEYTIAKANPTVIAPTVTATYGQTLADVTLPDGWTWADSTQSVGNVGSNTFKANFAGDDNYKAASNVDVTVTVSKAANPATVTNTAYVTRGGNTVDLSNNVTKNGATGDVTYAIDGEENGCTLSGSTLTSGDNSGSVTVNVTVAADDNYEALAATAITVTISDKPTQTITAEDVTATYGETGKRVSATTDGDGAISYAVKDGSAGYIDVNAETGALTIKKVGTATVTVMAAETSTYAAAIKNVTITIGKATPAVTAPTAKTLTYTGSAQNLVNAGSTPGGTLYYAVVSENKAPADSLYTTSIPTGTAVGTYYVWYKVVGDSNYNDTDPVCLTVKIGEPQAAEEDIIFVNGVSRNKVTIGSDKEVTYPSLLPYSYSKGKSKDFYRLYGMTVSSNGIEYAVTKGKVVVVKIKDGDGTITLDYYMQITGLTLMENGKVKTTPTKDDKKAAKTLARELKNATKVDKKAAKTGVGKSDAGIHVTVYPYSLSEENVSDSDNGLTNLVLSGKSGKYQLKYTFGMTNKKGKVMDGKKDAQKDPATVTYNKDTGLITVSSCEIQGNIPLSSNKITNKTKDIK